MEELLRKIEEKAKQKEADVKLALREIPEGLIVVDKSWDGLVIVVWAATKEEMEEKLKAIIRGMRILLRRTVAWVFRSPGDWKAMEVIGRLCEPYEPPDKLDVSRPEIWAEPPRDWE